MSHFLTVVILKRNIKQVEKGIAELFKPFDESKKMPKYETACGCVGRMAEREAREAAEAKFGTIKVVKEKFWSENTQPEYPDERKCKGLSKEEKTKLYNEYNKKEAVLDKKWSAALAPRLAFEKDFAQKHPKKNEPDPTCGFWTEESLKSARERNREHKLPPDKEIAKAKPGDRYKDKSGCGGTGKLISTYNQKSKWDWYQIGGRFTGAFVPEYEPSADPENVEQCWVCQGTGKRDDALGKEAREKDPSYTCNGCDGNGKSVKYPGNWKSYAGDVMVVGALPKDLVPFAICVEGEDGSPVWMEKGTMGWWAMVSNEKDPADWEKQVRAIFDKHKNDIAVAVDCHI